MESTATKLSGLSEIVLMNVLNYMKKNNLTKEQLAGEIGVSRPVLSKAINGKYDSNIDNIQNSIVDFLKKKGAYQEIVPVEQMTSKPSFFKTKDAANIIGVCQACQKHSSLGIIVGKSGFGKTYALKQYAKMPKAIYIECDDTMGSKDLLESIERELGIPTSYGSVWKRVSGIKDFFTVNEGYVVIIDEADKLINKYTQKKMELLRAIFDQSQVGLVIAGEPRLEVMIKSYLNRFANRVDFYSSLKGLRKDEVKTWLSYYNFTEEAVEEITARACNSHTGCFRLLDRTLKNIFRIADQDDEITVEIIKQASNMMML